MTWAGPPPSHVREQPEVTSGPAGGSACLNSWPPTTHHRAVAANPAGLFRPPRSIGGPDAAGRLVTVPGPMRSLVVPRLASARIGLLAGLLIAWSVSAAALVPGAAAEGRWVLLCGPLDAPPRAYHSTVYDPVRRRLLSLGESRPNALWELALDDPVEWRVVPCDGAPPPELGEQSVIYDPAGDRLILFGGLCDAILPCAGDVWSLTLAGPPTWSRVQPAGPAPPARFGQSAIYDPVGRRMIVFGGENTSRGRLGDVWSLSLADPPAWTEIAPGGPGPAPRVNHCSIYDPVRQRMLVYGGWDHEGFTANSYFDLWALSLTGEPRWTELHPLGSPAGSISASAVYDSVGDRLIVTGGKPMYFGAPSEGASQLQLSGELNWTKVTPMGRVPALYAHSAIVDPDARRMIVTGGKGSPGDATRTLALSLRGAPVWSTLEPAEPSYYPGRRPSESAFLDAARERLLVFLGTDPPEFTTEIWAWSTRDASGWSQVTTSGEPLPRVAQGTTAPCAYDSRRDRLVFFSGSDAAYNNRRLDEVVALNLDGTATGARLYPTGTAPPGRVNYSAVYDPVRDQVIVFGGTRRTGPSSSIGASYDDAWALSLGSMTWAPLMPAGTAPPSRARHQAFYDPIGDRMVVFGGLHYESDYLVTPLRDAWALSLGAGSAWEPLGADAPADGAGLLDITRNRLLMFGAAEPGVWTLPLDGASSWAMLGIPGGPPPRSDMALAWDPIADRALLYGGQLGGALISGSASRGDAWALDFAAGTPLDVSVVLAVAAPHRVTLEWSAPGSPGLTASLERWTAGTVAWDPIATLTADAGGRLAHEDHTVGAGARYRYRLGVRDRDEVSYYGSVSVAVPPPAPLPSPPEQPAIFALLGATPNPAVSGLVVSFSLPDALPARLELMDVAGRRLVTREVGTLGAGVHVIDLAAGRTIRAGVYLIRLTRDGRSVVSRAVTIR